MNDEMRRRSWAGRGQGAGSRERGRNRSELPSPRRVCPLADTDESVQLPDRTGVARETVAAARQAVCSRIENLRVAVCSVFRNRERRLCIRQANGFAHLGIATPRQLCQRKRRSPVSMNGSVGFTAFLALSTRTTGNESAKNPECPRPAWTSRPRWC